MKRRRRLSIATVLLAMNLAALALPLSGLWFLRLYESALIRQTESELIAQAGVLAAVYRSAWLAAGGQPDRLGRPVDPRWTQQPGYDDPWMPRVAGLDLAEDPVLPPPPEPVVPMDTVEPAAARAGVALSPILGEAQRVTLAGMRVTDHQGIVVASSGEEFGLSLAAQEEVRRALAGEPVSVLRDRSGAPAFGLRYGLSDYSAYLRVFTAHPVLVGDRVIGVILLSRTPRSLAATLYGKRWHLAGLAVLLLVSIGVLARLGTVAISRPLRTVTALAKRTAEGERGVMTPLRRPAVREVAELSEALTRMAATLEQRADYIRDFAAHVSHEFKSPLTTFRGTVELLRDHLDSMSVEERDRFLANMGAEAERLSRLVRRLLELARADVLAVDDDVVSDAVPVAAAVAARLGARTRLPGALPVAMARDALESVLSNLVDNAVRHGGPGVEVTVAVCAEGDQAVIRVSDDGPGVSAANAARIFDPFFTTARNRGGTGLGLAITKGLVAAHGGSLALLPSARGAVFEVRLRRPPARGGASGQ